MSADDITKEFPAPGFLADDAQRGLLSKIIDRIKGGGDGDTADGFDFWAVVKLLLALAASKAAAPAGVQHQASHDMQRQLSQNGLLDALPWDVDTILAFVVKLIQAYLSRPKGPQPAPPAPAA
jgi:hypothetical protein